MFIFKERTQNEHHFYKAYGSVGLCNVFINVHSTFDWYESNFCSLYIDFQIIP